MLTMQIEEKPQAALTENSEDGERILKISRIIKL